MSLIKKAEEPSPSGDGLSTIDMGDNNSDNDYKPEDSGSADDLFGGGEGGEGGGDLFGGGGGGGGLGGDSGGDQPNAAGDANAAPIQNLTPEELFVATNQPTYDVLVNDIKNVLTEIYLPGSWANSEHLSLNDEDVENVVQNLLRKGWELEVLMQLSFNSKGNLENLVSDVIDHINKNVSSKIEILGILNKLEGGHEMTQAKTFQIADGKVKTVKTAEQAPAVKLSSSEKFKQAKDKLGVAIIQSKRTLKKANDGINRINGILHKRTKIANEMAMEETPAAATGEGMEAPAEQPAPEMGGLDKEMSTELSNTGSDFDAIMPAIEQLTEAVTELKDALGGVEPGEIEKTEYDNAESMIEEGNEIEDDLHEKGEEVEDLQTEVAAAFSKKGGKKVKQATSYEAKKHEDTVPKAEEPETAGIGESKKEEKSASAKPRLFDKFLHTKESATAVDKTDISKVASAKDILYAEQIIPALEKELIASDADFDAIPNSVVASWDDLKGPVTALKESGNEKIAEVLVKRAYRAHQEVKASNVGDVRSAKWNEGTTKDIGETSKVMDDRKVEENVARGGDIDKGNKATHSEFNSDSAAFPENFGDLKGEGLADSMGDKNLEGKHVKAEFTQDTELFVRKAMEIAAEEQFKHIIPNPIAIAMTKEFLRMGLGEAESIKAAFRVLSEGYEKSFKLAIQRGLEHCKKSEQEILRRSKEVATYRVALFDEEAKTASEQGEQVKTASARKPALRSGQSVELSQEAESKIDKIFASMKQY